MSILNLTQHDATSEQIQAGVVEPADKAAVRAALSFEELPSSSVLKTRAETLAVFARQMGHKSAMIGGAPFFMGALEKELIKFGIKPLYSFFSYAPNKERYNSDGCKETIKVFKHTGFIGLDYTI